MTNTNLNSVLTNITGSISSSLLPTSNVFGKVRNLEKRMPETVISGTENSKNLHTVHLATRITDKSSVTEAPYFNKEKGVSMSDEGFVKLPRSLINDSKWKGLREKYKKVFLTILCHCSYQQRKFSILHNLVTIYPGQLCISIRGLVDLCNDGIRFKEDLVDKNIVERAVSLFTTLDFVRQEVRHGKTIITITFPEIYEHFQNISETASETKVRQNRDTNEERKESKEIRETIDRAKAPVSSLSKKEEKEEWKGLSNFSNSDYPKISPEAQKHFDSLWSFVVKQGVHEGREGKPGLKHKDIEQWLKSYDPKEIYDCIKMSLNAEISKTYGAYVTGLLKKRISKKENDSVSGRDLVASFIKKYKLQHLEMKKDYFKDLISQEQTYYYLPVETLTAILKRSLERSIDRYEEEKKQEQREENY